MLELDQKVVRKGTKNPVGIVEEVFGVLSVTVRWGIADQNVFREDIHQDELEPYDSNSHYKPAVKLDPIFEQVLNLGLESH